VCIHIDNETGVVNMTTKIQINLDNVITSKDQVKPGMHLWQVGQGGVSNVNEPSYMGQVIGFGSSDYQFADNAKQATHFIINDPYSPEVEFVVLASNLRSNPRSESYVIPEEGFPRHKPFPLNGLLENPFSGESVYASTHSYLPQSYNNWYMCDSLEKAQAVYEEMLANWTAQHEVERAEYERTCDQRDSWLDDMDL
jgi:hypothetical protein